jgi:hypothetical protein
MSAKWQSISQVMGMAIGNKTSGLALDPHYMYRYSPVQKS